MSSFLTKVPDNLQRFFSGVNEKFQAKFKLNFNQVVQEYENFLQCGKATTSSFSDILDGKLNPRKRAFQLTFMLYYLLYVIPRYSFLTFLSFEDEETRMHYQYILADYAEEMGMFGRAFNAAYVIFGIGMMLDDIVMRKFEAEGSLEFLTDWLKRVPKKPRIEDGDGDDITAPGDLNNESRHKLIFGLHYKLIFARIMTRITNIAVESFEFIALSVFIYKHRPSFFITCLGLWNFITLWILYPSRRLSFLQFVSVLCCDNRLLQSCHQQHHKKSGELEDQRNDESESHFDS